MNKQTSISSIVFSLIDLKYQSLDNKLTAKNKHGKL